MTDVQGSESAANQASEKRASAPMDVLGRDERDLANAAELLEQADEEFVNPRTAEANREAAADLRRIAVTHQETVAILRDLIGVASYADSPELGDVASDLAERAQALLSTKSKTAENWLIGTRFGVFHCFSCGWTGDVHGEPVGCPNQLCDDQPVAMVVMATKSLPLGRDKA